MAITHCILMHYLLPIYSSQDGFPKVYFALMPKRLINPGLPPKAFYFLPVRGAGMFYNVPHQSAAVRC